MDTFVGVAEGVLESGTIEVQQGELPRFFISKALAIFYCVYTYLVHHEVGQVGVVVVELV